MIGTGVMVGLPGQTLRDLAGDILFFKEIGANMIGGCSVQNYLSLSCSAGSGEMAVGVTCWVRERRWKAQHRGERC